MQIELTQLRQMLLASRRHSDPKRLTHHGYKAYSQNDEDGIIAEIFRRIGETNRTFIEFGVENGRECNTLWLLMQGWNGLWLQGSEEDCRSVEGTHQSFIADGSLRIKHAFVTRENINDLFLENDISGSVDFLSIDIDRNDYWVWEAIEAVTPRVVAIEYNATWAPPARIVVPYAADEPWNGSNYFGASLSALATLGKSKGYSLVGCCLAGVNAFFVQSSLVRHLFLSPGDPQEHYEPARYFFSQLASGHPTAVGPVVRLQE